MIKVNCKGGIEPVREQYPCLKITKKGRIVLFTAPGVGCELEGGENSTRFHYCDVWIKEDFQLYTGTIELSNEV